jgi:hypothetical protein
MRSLVAGISGSHSGNYEVDLRNVTLCCLVHKTNISEKPTASIFRITWLSF